MDPRYVKTTHTVPASYPRHPSTVVSPDIKLQLVVEEYIIPAASPHGLTLLFTHGNSFNKGLWEMIIKELLEKPTLSSRIKRVLALDAANHGDSAVANIGKLASDQSFWPDHCRDILKVLEHFRVEAPVVGIGHSYGGGTLSYAAMTAPSAFVATVFVDPIIFEFRGMVQAMADQALRRRDRWNTREEASKAFKRSRAMSEWHPEQLQKYIDTGIREVKSQGNSYWTLKTTKEQEAASYLAAPSPSLLDLLENSRQRHYFILGQESFVLKPERQAEIKAIVKSPERVKTLTGVGHLIPMTHPHLLADELARILMEVVGSLGSAKL